MNQTPRIIKRTCCVCRGRSAWVRQDYDTHLSDYIDLEMPICEECRKKEEQTIEETEM